MEIKAPLEELSNLIRQLLTVLDNAEAEAKGQSLQGDADWVQRSIENVTAYLAELETAKFRAEPLSLQHALRNLWSLGRFLLDYDWSWFTNETELDTLVDKVAGRAGSIDKQINRFDQSSLVVVRRALQ